MEQPLCKLRDQKQGLTFADAMALAASSGRRLARNAEFDRYFEAVKAGPALTLSNNAWTETILAYPMPKKPFGDAVEWADYRAKVRYHLDTKEFKGLKNAAITFEGCELVADGATVLFIPSSEVRLVERFPQECGFYATLPGCGIPYDDGGDRRPGFPGTRHLTRDNRGGWVGPLVRPYSRIQTPDNLDQEVYACFSPLLNMGVFVAEKS